MLQCSCTGSENFPKKAVPPPLEKHTWSGPHYELFATRGRALKPERTEELLRDLAKIYEPYPNAETNGRKAKVKALLNLSTIEVASCRHERFSEFDKLKDYYEVYWLNLHPYLAKWEERLIEFCLQNVDKIFLHNMEKYFHNPAERKTSHEKFDEMMEKILDAEGAGHRGYQPHGTLVYGSYVVSDESIVKGVCLSVGQELKNGIWKNKLQELRAARRSRKRKLKFRSHVTQELNRSVMNDCRNWVAALHPVVILISLDVQPDLGQEQISWIEKYEVCKKILKLEEDIGRCLEDSLSSRKALVKEHGQPSLRQKLLDYWAKYREKVLLRSAERIAARERELQHPNRKILDSPIRGDNLR